jgi:hypothetical protein
MHGSYAANMAMTASDLLIALGVRFDDRVTGRLAAFAPHAKVIHVDIDPAEIGKNRAVDLPIVGDVKRVLEKLNKVLEELAPQSRQNHRRQRNPHLDLAQPQLEVSLRGDSPIAEQRQNRSARRGMTSYSCSNGNRRTSQGLEQRIQLTPNRGNGGAIQSQERWHIQTGRKHAGRTGKDQRPHAVVPGRFDGLPQGRHQFHVECIYRWAIQP